MNDPTHFAARRDEHRTVGCATAVGLVVALAPPLDVDPGPVPVTPECRLCGAVAVLYLSLVQTYQDPGGRDLGEDADLGIGVCALCAETHAPGLLAAQRDKTLTEAASRRGDDLSRAAFLGAHDHVRAAVPALLLALGLDEETTAQAAAMPDPYDS